MRTALVALFAALSAAIAQGEPLTWVRTAASGSWGKVSNWLTLGGDATEVAPTNGEDVVLPPYEFNAANKDSHVRIGTGALTGSASAVYLSGESVDPTVGSLSGSHQFFIEHGTHRDYTVPYLRRFTVSNPDGFAGYFTSGDVRACLTLNSTPEHSLSFPSIGAKSRLYVEVPTAGTSASVDTVYEEGVVSKIGAGDLEIGATRGANTDIYVMTGGVTLVGFEGGSEAKLNSLLSQARVHLDASVESSLEKYVDPADSRTCVSKWNDVRGNGFYAMTNAMRSTVDGRLPYIRAPFVSPATSPTGLPFVDFGTQNYWAANGLGELYGPTNCGMYFSTEITGIREVFYVAETPGSAYLTCTLGSPASIGTYYFINQYNATLFSPHEATTNVWCGELAYNGQAMGMADLSAKMLTNCYVISVGTLGPAAASALGVERDNVITSGGVRIGEVLLFTNTLTRAERMLVNGYLVNKWRTGEMMRDAGSVIMSSAATGLTVPAGHEVHVRSVAVQSSSLVKKGGGTLRVDMLYPPTVTVEGGAVAFNNSSIATDAPADGAYLWLDATKDDTLSKVQPGGDFGTTNYVSTWKDCRDGIDLYATATVSGAASAAAAEPPIMPTPITLEGRQALSFGDYGPGTLAMMKFPSFGTSKAYAGFIVVRNRASNSGQNIFGCSNIELMRGGVQLHCPTYSNPKAQSAKWTINGEPVDPCNLTTEQLKYANYNDRTSVIAFSGLNPVRCDGLCFDRETRSGRMNIGEVIIYHHPISESERVQTEAYLMKKWLNRDHPEALFGRNVSSLSFADDTPVVFGMEADAEIAEVSGGDGNLVKTGDGDVTIRRIETSNPVTNIVVEGGSLGIPAVGSAKFHRLQDDMLYHLDAMDTSTLTMVDGTKVSRWKDCRKGSSVYMNSCWPNNIPDSDFAKVVKGYPTLVDVETRSGVTRKMLDLGYQMDNNATLAPPVTNSAMLRFPSVQTGLRETLSIFADAHGRRDIPFFSTVDWGLVHIRGYNNNGRLFANDTTYTGNWADGYVSIDCTPISSTAAVYPAGVHLLSMCTAAGTSFNFAAFGNERKYRAGGCMIGEQIGFTRELNATEREFLQKRLMAKWFGESQMVFTNECDSIEVMLGATFEVASDGYIDEGVLVADRLAGGGTIVADRVETLYAETMPMGLLEYAPLTVSGTLAFGEGAVLKARLGSRRGVQSGTYTLLAADSIEGECTVDYSDFGAGFEITTVVEGGAVKAVIKRAGLVIMVE